MVNVVIEKIIHFLRENHTRRITLRQLNALFRAYMLTDDERKQVIIYLIKNGVKIEDDNGGFVMDKYLEAERKKAAAKRREEEQEKQKKAHDAAQNKIYGPEDRKY